MKPLWVVAAVLFVPRSLAAEALDQWSLRYAGNHDLQFVTYTSGLFVAGGEKGRIVTSPDGVEWSEHSADTNTFLTGVTSDGRTNFVAVGETRDNQLAPAVFKSPDGKSWHAQAITVRDQLGNALTNLHRDVGMPLAVAFGGGVFALATSSEQGSQLFDSEDLTNWYAATPPERPIQTMAPFYNVLVPAKVEGTDVMVAAGSIWVPIRLGMIEELGSRRLWRFEDVHPAGSGYAQAGAYGNGLFVLVGMEMPTLVSTNGRAWSSRLNGEPPVFPNSPTPEYLRLNFLVGNNVAFGNGTFVTLDGAAKDMLISTNGFWERRQLSIAPWLRSTAYGAGRFVTVGGRSIFASAHVATPGLAIQQKSGITPTLQVSGEIGREYLVERSPNLIIWIETERLTMDSPKVERPIAVGAPAAFYRATLLK